jgi:hypothetical protein
VSCSTNTSSHKNMRVGCGYVCPWPSCQGGPLLCCPSCSSSLAVLSPHPAISPLAVTPAWWLSLSFSHFVLLLSWVVVLLSLFILCHSVVLLMGRSLVLIKLKEKITHKQDQEVTPPGPPLASPLVPPIPVILVPAGCCSHHHCVRVFPTLTMTDQSWC